MARTRHKTPYKKKTNQNQHPKPFHPHLPHDEPTTLHLNPRPRSRHPQQPNQVAQSPRTNQCLHLHAATPPKPAHRTSVHPLTLQAAACHATKAALHLPLLRHVAARLLAAAVLLSIITGGQVSRALDRRPLAYSRLMRERMIMRSRRKSRRGISWRISRRCRRRLMR